MFIHRKWILYKTWKHIKVLFAWFLICMTQTLFCSKVFTCMANSIIHLLKLKHDQPSPLYELKCYFVKGWCAKLSPLFRPEILALWFQEQRGVIRVHNMEQCPSYHLSFVVRHVLTLPLVITWLPVRGPYVRWILLYYWNWVETDWNKS